jgi:hypothetical protein
LAAVVNASTNVFVPGDEVVLFENTGTGLNRSSVASYFYHDGSSGFLGAGWYQSGSLAASGSVEIPAGGAFWIRKAAASGQEIAEWNPPVPYTL